MMCGPVLIQWFSVVGFVAYGSVLLASVPPASMYMKPTLPAGGALWPIQAPAHSIAFLSMHIGSGPGVVGLSGMQVQPFLPSRRVFIAPSGCASTIVASPETEAGAAAIALSIGSVGCAVAALAVSLPLACAPGGEPARSQAANARAAQAPSR